MKALYTMTSSMHLRNAIALWRIPRRWLAFDARLMMRFSRQKLWWNCEAKKFQGLYLFQQLSREVNWIVWLQICGECVRACNLPALNVTFQVVDQPPIYPGLMKGIQQQQAFHKCDVTLCTKWSNHQDGKVGFQVELNKSSIQIKKNIGPKTLPYGTPVWREISWERTIMGYPLFPLI